MGKSYKYGLREVKYQLETIERLIQVFNEDVVELQNKFHSDKEKLRDSLRLEKLNDGMVASNAQIWVSKISMKIDKKPASRSRQLSKLNPAVVYVPFLSRAKRGAYKERISGVKNYIYDIHKVLTDRDNCIPVYEVPLLTDTIEKMNELIAAIVSLKTIYVEMLELSVRLERYLEGHDETV